MFKPTAHNRIQLHILKTYAASNLNRDDLGAPKEVIFGGSRRLRISSQSIKRAVRSSEVFENFRDYAAKTYNGAVMIRTTRVAETLRGMLAGTEQEVVDATVKRVMTLLGAKAQEKLEKENAVKAKAAKEEGKEVEKAAEKTQLVAFSQHELQQVADKVRNLKTAKEATDALKSVLNDKNRMYGDFSAEAQLFGRMVTAEEGFASIDSPLQVAHAMTTHETSIQRDYWTGVDDLNAADGTAGSGMIDVRRFGSGTFYLYSCLDLDLLLSNLRRAFTGVNEEDVRAIARDTACAWVYGLVMSNPTGYQNSFAAHDLPSTIGVEVGTSFPYTAAKAFEKPVEAMNSDGKLVGYEANSVARLLEWDEQRQKQYQGQVRPLRGIGLGAAGGHESVDEMVKSIGEQVDAIFAGLDMKKAA